MAEDCVPGAIAKPSGIARSARRAAELAGDRVRVVSGAAKKMPQEIKAQVRRAEPLWPLAGQIAMLAPDALVPEGLQSSLRTARALIDLPPCEPWFHLKPRQPVSGTPVALFSGCTAQNARPRWVAKAESLLKAWAYTVLDASGFTCCGGTLHHAGQFQAQGEVRARNIDIWRALGKPLVASFCASCKHSLDGYAEVLPEVEKQEWLDKNTALSALLTDAVASPTGKAPAAVGYHQPCHWAGVDLDLPLLGGGLPSLKHGTGLCCGMGGILKMSNPDLSEAMAKACMQGFDTAARHVVTGCSGCVMPLASVAPEGGEVRHWLDVAGLEGVREAGFVRAGVRGIPQFARDDFRANRGEREPASRGSWS